MDERRAYEVAIRLQEEDRARTKDFLITSLLEEDWAVVAEAATELRIIDTRLTLVKKILETMPK